MISYNKYLQIIFYLKQIQNIIYYIHFIEKRQNRIKRL